jgi:hypothetical protein
MSSRHHPYHGAETVGGIKNAVYNDHDGPSGGDDGD